MIVSVNARCSRVAVLGTHPSLRRPFCARSCQGHSLHACEHRLRRGQATGGKIYAFTDVTASIEQSRALVLEAIESATTEQWIAAGGAGIGITALVIQLKRAVEFVSSAIVFDEASALKSVEETLSAVDPVTPSYPPDVMAENEKLLMDAGRAEARQRSLVWMLFLTFMTFTTLDILVGDTAMQP